MGPCWSFHAPTRIPCQSRVLSAMGTSPSESLMAPKRWLIQWIQLVYCIYKYTFLSRHEIPHFRHTTLTIHEPAFGKRTRQTRDHDRTVAAAGRAPTVLEVLRDEGRKGRKIRHRKLQMGARLNTTQHEDKSENLIRIVASNLVTSGIQRTIRIPSRGSLD
jgi:hypothetical protein